MRLAQSLNDFEQRLIQRAGVMLQGIDYLPSLNNLSISYNGRFNGCSPKIDPNGSALCSNAKAERGERVKVNTRNQ